ncbi:MAG: cation-translocating P-type ATPase, partial [Dictyoglomus sp.]
NVRVTGDGSYVGDPLDVALCKNYEALFNKVDKVDLERVDEIPFDSLRKRLSILYKNNLGTLLLCVKGAGEEILKRSTMYIEKGILKKMTEEDQKRFTALQDLLAEDGLRVLAVAKRELSENLSKEKWEEELVFLGFIAFMDPLREGVKEAIDRCKDAGIRPIIVTGDYLLTAKKIAKDLGINVEDGVSYTGENLQKDNFKNLSWDKVVLFSRVLPEHKMHIVRELKQRGEIVAMTGDGVNDAPALKMADIGVAMGLRGTDVAREASDLVLLDDSFATIVKAVEEGRRIFDNIKKVTYYLLSCNFSEILIVSLSIFLGYPLPLTPIELLWINLVTDGFPALALGVDPPGKDIMKRKPRRIDEGIINKDMWRNIVLDGAIMGISAFILFNIGLKDNLTVARTMAFSGLVFAQIFQALRLSLKRRRHLMKEAFDNKYLSLVLIFSFILQLLVMFTSIGSKFFNLGVLKVNEFLLTILVGLMPIYIFIGERMYEKIFKRTSDI